MRTRALKSFERRQIETRLVQLKNLASKDIRKNNLLATTNPTVNDDSGAGYEPLSRWLNTTTGEGFLCIDAAVGAANWQQATLTLDELGSSALVNVTDIVERVTNANGLYVKYNDGTLIQKTVPFVINYATNFVSQNVTLPTANTDTTFGITLNRTQAGAGAGEVSLSAKIGLFASGVQTVSLGLDDADATYGSYEHVITTFGTWS